jgi:hypothetical protein
MPAGDRTDLLHDFGEDQEMKGKGTTQPKPLTDIEPKMSLAQLPITFANEPATIRAINP